MLGPKVCVVDYGVGNLFSIQRAIEFAGGEAVVESRPEAVVDAERLVLPGVGAFEAGMQELGRRNLIGALNRYLERGRPLLGICLGMQLLFSESEEFGTHRGLGFMAGRVVRFHRSESVGRMIRIPHMGWSSVDDPHDVSGGIDPDTCWDNGLLGSIPKRSFFYFVHSFFCLPADSGLVVANTQYGNDRFASVVHRDHIWGCQFHPERSGPLGLRLYKNFLKL